MKNDEIINLFLKNEPIFWEPKMNITPYPTNNYNNLHDMQCKKTNPNEPNSKPIKPQKPTSKIQTNPKQTQKFIKKWDKRSKEKEGGKREKRSEDSGVRKILKFPVQFSVADSLSDVFGLDGFTICKVSDCAGDFAYLIMSSSR